MLFQDTHSNPGKILQKPTKNRFWNRRKNETSESTDSDEQLDRAEGSIGELAVVPANDRELFSTVRQLSTVRGILCGGRHEFLFSATFSSCVYADGVVFANFKRLLDRKERAIER
jgi:hypothetical protein